MPFLKSAYGRGKKEAYICYTKKEVIILQFIDAIKVYRDTGELNFVKITPSLHFTDGGKWLNTLLKQCRQQYHLEDIESIFLEGFSLALKRVTTDGRTNGQVIEYFKRVIRGHILKQINHTHSAPASRNTNYSGLVSHLEELKLSDRQKQVAGMLSNGMALKDIAEELHLYYSKGNKNYADTKKVKRSINEIKRKLMNIADKYSIKVITSPVSAKAVYNAHPDAVKDYQAAIKHCRKLIKQGEDKVMYNSIIRGIQSDIAVCQLGQIFF